MKGSVWILVGLLLWLIAASGCSDDGKVGVTSLKGAKAKPTMTTRNVATFISDSGTVQYKVVAPLWVVWDQADTPSWSFPEGIYLQKFDPYFHIVAEVAADSARFFSREKLWRLDGHVEMKRNATDLFQTEQLFWSQREHKIYTDSFIHIETATQMLEGYGFESDEKLSSYRVVRPQGIFPVDNPTGMPGRQGGNAEASKGSTPVSLQNMTQ